MVLFLTRQYFPDGTNGKLQCEGKQLCYTIELPWRQNQRSIFCIPEGELLIEKTLQQQVQMAFGSRCGEQQAPLILIHPANNAQLELNGCIAPVTWIAGPGLGLQSRKAFVSLKELHWRKKRKLY